MYQDNKKKKKKKGQKETKAPVLSAAAKAIFARKQQQEAEEAALKKKQEEEEERIRLEEEREERERLAAEAIREKNRQKKADKIERQKAAGTYMTKAEKEKAKKAQARLESMKAAGMLNVEGDSTTSSTSKLSAAKFAKKKKKNTCQSPISHVNPDDIKLNEKDGAEEEIEDRKEEKTEVTPTLPVLDSWDDAGSDDDWESASSNVIANLEALKVKTGIGYDEEDALNVEKVEEQKRLKELGLERARRAEEERLKR